VDLPVPAALSYLGSLTRLIGKELMDHSSSPSLTVYYAVYGALMVLLVLTVAISYFHLGVLGIILALTIAVIKALLVMTYFMHLRYTSRLTWLFAGAGFVWLLIMLVGVIADYYSRGWVGQ
jgi:cytochrome c oxidase subunit 4